jgi:tetratricopeptide (TPR) repeat protein
LSVYGKQLTEKDFPQHYIETYHVLTSKDHPLVLRANDIFNRVKNAADKCYKTPPTLIILKKNAVTPRVLKTGTILMSQKTLELCYQKVKQAVGDARIAFIMGHELAHLANTDYWKDESRDQLIPDTEIKRILEKDSKDNLQMELKADAYGMLYASMAGYQPSALIQKNGTIFFHNWSHQVSPSHPSPKARAAQLKHQVKSIQSTIMLFHIGLRLYQLGKYEDALPLLIAFQKTFPCREVSNLIGLVYYQQAMNALSEYDQQNALQYKLSVILDMETRADKFRTNARDQFHENIKNAIWHFKMACEKDQQYVPSRINLSASLILNGRMNGAIDILDEALNIKNNDPQALNNKAIAMYLLGKKINVCMFQKAVDLLQQVIQNQSQLPDAYYNLGQIMYERKRYASYKTYFKQYLERESFGNFAKNVHNILNSSYTENSIDCLNKTFSDASILPGEYNAGIKQTINGLHLKEHILPMGVYAGKYYSGHGYLILIMEGVVELVEEPVKKQSSFQRYCPHLKKYYNQASGQSTLIYGNWAVDTSNNKITKRIMFENEKKW